MLILDLTVFLKGYCYLLFLRKLMISMFSFIVIYWTSYSFYFLIVSFSTFDFIKNNSDVDYTESGFIVYMSIVITILFLLSMRSLRWNIQCIYFYYNLALNKDRGLNYLRLRTLLIKGIPNIVKNDIELKKLIQNLLNKHAIYGKVLTAKLIKDQSERFALMSKKFWLKEQKNLEVEEKDNSFVQFLIPSSVKNQNEYDRNIKEIDLEIDNLKTPEASSTFGFVCLSNFEAIRCLKKYKPTFFKKIKYSQFSSSNKK